MRQRLFQLPASNLIGPIGQRHAHHSSFLPPRPRLHQSRSNRKTPEDTGDADNRLSGCLDPVSSGD